MQTNPTPGDDQDDMVRPLDGPEPGRETPQLLDRIRDRAEMNNWPACRTLICPGART